MSSTLTHYEQLLGPVYTWMAGGFDTAVARNRQQLNSLGLNNWPRGLAVDLGCGSGFQSVPLADAGYQVLGIDLCAALLTELNAQTGNLPITTVCADLLDFPAHLQADATLIVCMGDTLTHLPSLDSLTELFRKAARHLVPGGRLVLGFRDLASHELKGAQRFIPVRNEADRIFTCFLDYHHEHVEVHDLLYVRTGETWNFTSSSYRKLRLSGAQVAELLATAGFAIEHHTTEQGLVRLVASPSVK